MTTTDTTGAGPGARGEEAEPVDIYDKIRAERRRQPGLGYTPEHDDEQGIGHLTYYANQYAREAYYLHGDTRENKLVKAAALLVAALEVHERAQSRLAPIAPDVPQEDR